MKKCDECDYENVKGSNLYVHKRQHHMKHLKQKCSECNNTYHYPSTLKKHFKQVHLKIRRKQNGGNSYKVICRKKDCLDYEQQHCKEMDIHKVFACDQCSFSNQRKDSLNIHIQSVHEGVVFKCDQCTVFSAKRKIRLKEHMLSKHPSPEQRANPLLCAEDECTFLTVGEMNMKIHMREKHEGRIRYRCNIMNCNFGTCRKKNIILSHKIPQ